MKIVVFGLTISSSWGNGHATLLRGLFSALVARGHRIAFFEYDVPYYAAHRDLLELPGVELHLYDNWANVCKSARRELIGADIGIVTSYCPHAIEASELVINSNVAVRVFYDLDTPVTLESVQNDRPVSYISERGLLDFDLVLSYTGGAALNDLRELLGARTVAPLYGSVDPRTHYPQLPRSNYVCDLSYLGTYADDRQAVLERLFLQTADASPDRRFLIGGSKYPPDFPWRENIWYVQHVPPAQHASFYSSSRLTLNITRSAMAHFGFCPSGRLFEAAACRTAIVSDSWEGLDEFFRPGVEIIVASDSCAVEASLSLGDAELKRIGDAAYERVLSSHTARQRALEFERILDSCVWSASREATAVMEL